MVYSLRIYRLHICNTIHSFTTPLAMKNKTTQRIQLIKFGIGILIGVTIYLILILIL